MKFALIHAGDLGIRFDCDESHESSDHDEIHKSLTIVAAVPRTSKLSYETLAQEAALVAPRAKYGQRANTQLTRTTLRAGHTFIHALQPDDDRFPDYSMLTSSGKRKVVLPSPN
jgi:hypothetical protein